MKNKYPKVPIIPNIEPDETILSYFKYLSNANRMPFSVFLNMYVDKNNCPGKTMTFGDIDGFAARNEAPSLPDACEIITRHTTLPVLSMFMPNGEAAMKTTYLLHKHSYSLILPPKTYFGAQRENYCPLCAREDPRPYARVQHQYPGVKACSKHKCLLVKDITEDTEPKEGTKFDTEYASFVCAAYENPVFIDRTALYQTVIKKIAPTPAEIYDRSVSAFFQKCVTAFIQNGIDYTGFLELAKDSASKFQNDVFHNFYKSIVDRYDILAIGKYLAHLRCKSCGTVFWTHVHAMTMGLECPECFSKLTEQAQYDKMTARFKSYEVIAAGYLNLCRVKNLNTGLVSVNLRKSRALWADTPPETNKVPSENAAQGITIRDANGNIAFKSPFGTMETPIPAKKQLTDAYNQAIRLSKASSSDFPDGKHIIGDIKKTPYGTSMMIIRRDDKNHVTLLFDNGTIMPCASYVSYSNNHLNGAFNNLMIHEYLDLCANAPLPITKENLSRRLIGKQKMAKCKMMMTIVKVENIRSIKVRFEDGKTAAYNRYEDFLTGNIQPAIMSEERRRADKARIQRAREKHVGETTTTIDGLKAVLVEWRDARHVIAQTEDGQKYEIPYNSFLAGFSMGTRERMRNKK